MDDGGADVAVLVGVQVASADSNRRSTYQRLAGYALRAD
jgi:hypothetical protein